MIVDRFDSEHIQSVHPTCLQRLTLCERAPIVVDYSERIDPVKPLSRTNAVNNQYEQVGFAPLYTARGRFFHVEASYTFK